MIGFNVGTRLHSVQLENCPELTDLAAMAVANKLKTQLTTLSVGAHILDLIPLPILLLAACYSALQL